MSEVHKKKSKKDKKDKKEKKEKKSKKSKKRARESSQEVPENDGLKITQAKRPKNDSHLGSIKPLTGEW